ncbi:DnaJ family molecular chaperone [Microbaculum marinum]|uniref:DnaJ family molecular chaperone n=1 Tax=Microbaculum marinum TaxID=1764581 RepID=A0AAW9RUB0_9HYPH
MSIWGKIGGAAAGLALGGPLGALIGAVAGHMMFDRGKAATSPQQAQLAFTIGVIALAAKMAKADGVVTDDEVRAFRQVFEVPERDVGHVARVFELANRSVDGYEAYARQLAALFGEQPDMLEDVIDGLFHIAKADGAIHERELAYLQNVATIFGFSETDFERIAARHVRPDGEDPYLILGIDRSAGADEIKRVYRKLVAENHPDRAVARGLPEEFVKIATEKLARINGAYDRIERERGL